MHLTNADYRRGAALILHHAARDEDGVGAIVAETSEQHRPVELLGAVLKIYEDLLPELRAPLGVEFLRSYIASIAAAPEVE